MNKIPWEIIREEIMPYTYMPQPSNLCLDIRSYYNIRDYLFKLYYERWKFSFEYEKNADKNWLENDIMRFMNEDFATMNGYTYSHLKKYERLFVLKDEDPEIIINYINKHTAIKNNVMSSINIQLGLLTYEERHKLVDFVHELELGL